MAVSLMSRTQQRRIAMLRSRSDIRNRVEPTAARAPATAQARYSFSKFIFERGDVFESSSRPAPQARI
ncbi:hypothetical protein [Bradyrhizobium pachyrhizi]|uniref:hypothetical protein n=1 Tax=Bradyrhizobium pachyrhizi TaxID=280333 RepID=UPI000AAA441E|nr:hypothetical protein [Bradyrhizobium pachyrhizi]